MITTTRQVRDFTTKCKGIIPFYARFNRRGVTVQM